MKLIQRDFYLDKLKDVMGTPDIKVITGLRRSGKSKLLEAFMDYVKTSDPNANMIHVNFNLNNYESTTLCMIMWNVPMCQAGITM